MTDSGNPEDGVTYTMSAEQYNKYKNIVAEYKYVMEDYYGDVEEYKSRSEVYEYYKHHPEEWNETEFGDYKEQMKWLEEKLQSLKEDIDENAELLSIPITVNDVDGVNKVVLRYSETKINEQPEDAGSDILWWLHGINADYSFTAANGQIIADNLPLGYYIILPEGKYNTDENAVIPINLTNITPNKVVKSKAVPLSISKTADITNVSVGDIVNFSIEGTIPSFYLISGQNGIFNRGCKIYFSDEMYGMKLTGDWSLEIDGQPATDEWSSYAYNSSDMLWSDPSFLEEYKVEFQAQPEDFDNITIHGERSEDVKSALTNVSVPAAQGTSFTLGYYVEGSDVGKPFKLTYSAIVTEEAVRGAEGNTNDAMLICFDETSDGQSYEIYTAEDQETVYTYDMNLLKYADGDTSDVLPGAQFALYKQNEDGNKLYYKLTEDATLVEGKDLTGPTVTWVDIGDTPINQAIGDGDITAVTSDQDGKAAFTGIPHDTYYLQEVKAPNGYNLLAEDKVVELTADAPADFEVQVENTGGALLPETGGPGTALFTMMGLLLMAASTTFYLYQRKQTHK